VAKGFARFKPGSLSSFHFHCSDIMTTEEVTLWLAEATGCYGSTLLDFQMYMEMDDIWDGGGLVEFASGLDLTTLNIDIRSDVCLNDETLERLGRAIPSLEELELGSCDFSVLTATIWGVFGLLRNCQKMRSLTMDFCADADKNHLADIASHNLPKSSLVNLDVRFSTITDAMVVAELFSLALPHLESMDWVDDVEDCESWEDSDSIKWKYVWDFQQSFRRLHESPRRI
jgi:hypothetical protein